MDMHLAEFSASTKATHSSLLLSKLAGVQWFVHMDLVFVPIFIDTHTELKV